MIAILISVLAAQPPAALQEEPAVTGLEDFDRRLDTCRQAYAAHLANEVAPPSRRVPSEHIDRRFHGSGGNIGLRELCVAYSEGVEEGTRLSLERMRKHFSE